MGDVLGPTLEAWESSKFSLPIVIYQDEGASIANLTGASARFTVKATRAVAAATIFELTTDPGGGITVDTSSGTLTLTRSSGLMTGNGSWWYELSVRLAGDDSEIYTHGHLRMYAAVGSPAP